MSKQAKARKKRMSKRPHRIPTSYIEAVAGNIVEMRPSFEVAKNTVSGVYSVAYARGYGRDMDDSKLFRQRRQKAINDDWNKTRDLIDDLIHQTPKQ